MNELILRVKSGMPVNGVVAVAKAGVGTMVSYNGRILFCAERENRWKEVEGLQ